MSSKNTDPVSSSQQCPHFFKKNCGGCAFLHVSYQDQIAAKKYKVSSLLSNALRKLPPKVRPDLKRVIKEIVASPAPLGYRASAKLTLHQDKSGKQIIGLFAQGTRTVVSTAGCLANTQSVNELVQKMFAGFERSGLKFFDHSSTAFQKNCLKYLTVRTGAAQHFDPKQSAVIISHTGVDKQAIAKWMETLGLEALSVYESRLAKDDGDSLTGRTTTHVFGPETFPYQLIDRTFHISPASFFQANHRLAADLIACATGFERDGDTLLDLYGGFGAYSFAAKDRFKEIYVVDGNSAAIQAANAHAREHRVEHLKACNEMCEAFLRRLPDHVSNRVTHVLVNPARNGLSADVLKAVTSDSFRYVRELHYISCSPPTFARDALGLIESGFKLEELTPFDMFPQTDHVEIVAKFSRG